MLRLQLKKLRNYSQPLRFISQFSHPDHPVPTSVQNRIEKWSKSMLTPYARPPMILSRGQGCKVWDTEGREYLDFTAGIAVNALGHADKQVAEVMYQQAKVLVHCSNLYHNDQADPSPTPKDGEDLEIPNDHKVFFANSGAEANIEDPSGSKHELVCFTNGFHGRTFGALSVTNQPKYQTSIRSINTWNQTRANSREGGILEASEEFLASLETAGVDEVNAVLIYDEIQCGLGRTGSLWAHGALPTDCHPDMLTMAKPLANGVPIGAVMMRDQIAKKIAIGDHGTTFGGAPLQTTIAKHVLERICEESFMKQWTNTPDLLTGSVRGKGLILGLEVKNNNHQVGSEPTISHIISLARQNGLLLLSCGTSIIRFVPSLIVSHSEISQMIRILETVLTHLNNSKAS
ncbi:hypothetical protein H4Q26_006057 [Puccinia striiformis f. sp. tritici PST-130]|nr:hypothetical protein H4Q26_006057 [Puccinia striiformis f. sp. tritici PST-130]